MTIDALVSHLRSDRKIRSLTSFQSKTKRIRVSRHHTKEPGMKTESFLVSVGAPNYAEREFLKKAGPNPSLMRTEYPAPKRSKK